MAQMPNEINITVFIPKDMPVCIDGSSHRFDRVDDGLTTQGMISLCSGCGVILTYEANYASGS